MKVEKIEIRNGKFVDFTGAEREYTIAAISEVIEGHCVVDDDDIYDIYDHLVEIDDNYDLVVPCVDNVVKKLSIGFAIRNPQDKYNEEIGKQIAIGKARKKPSRVMYANSLGIINTTVVNAVLEQECRFFELNPSSVITGYAEAERKYKSGK